MKKTLFATYVAIAAICLSSCNKEATRASVKEESETTTLSVKVKGLPQTKGVPDTAIAEGEDLLNSLEVFVFPADGGTIDAYHSASDDEISGNTASFSLSCKTGKKHIYALANASVASDVETEDDLLNKISLYKDNALSDFIMVGSAKDASSSFEPTLTAGGSNSVSVQLRRIVSRVKIETVKAALEAPSLQGNDFVVKRVYLMNIPKNAAYFNGNYNDVFGVESRGTVTESPDGFAPASTVGVYYYFAAPAQNGSADDGLLNWEDHTTFTSSDEVTIDSSIKDMTCLEFQKSEASLYSSEGNALDGNTLSIGKYLYTYPNSSAPAEDENTVDFTTKLVIETEFTTSEGETTTYYYPISIPYTQPNYAYTIGQVTLKRLGNLTPFLPVSSIDCSFTVTVKDWESGDIIGKFNNETDDDDFEI